MINQKALDSYTEYKLSKLSQVQIDEMLKKKGLLTEDELCKLTYLGLRGTPNLDDKGNITSILMSADALKDLREYQMELIRKYYC
jgi:hypothetical protein